MKPFIKWPGGKEKELGFINEFKPSKIERYIEPFVGGGAVYFDINIRESLINDKSEELISLYKCIQTQDEAFFFAIEKIYKNWKALEYIVERHIDVLKKMYERRASGNDILNDIDNFIAKRNDDFNGCLDNEIMINYSNFVSELKRCINLKFNRMSKIEKERGLMSERDLLDNIECAIKGAFYMHMRYLYNCKKELNLSDSFHTAVFYWIREYCYSSMFRYNSEGKFNVPYGGISYNRKNFEAKIGYISSTEIYNYMKDTSIFCFDFEEFINIVNPEENDFIFVDPPYDSEFSTYAKNIFDREEQIRLADILHETKAKTMIVIKNTDFIYNLYKERGFKIQSFDKKYLVSFQNRNKKRSEHLLITNY